MLKLADNLKLPLEVVTQTIAMLAKRRAGKSYTMRRLVEQFVKAAQQVVLVDPKGDQWGVRSAADGKGPGLPLVILGGERADVPLEASAGELVAKLVVEERVSAVLDLSLFRKHEVATFMTGFLENLYRLKAREIYRTPMMLVIDEADAVAPQKPQKGEERMLGAAEDIVRRGGQRGIGCVLVSQRSAVLNKNVLTQAQILVALRTIAPQDLDAMKAWIDVHGSEEQRRTLMESLPSLPVGDAWFWSPGWPTVDGIFQRVHVLPIETFDSGATPKPGEKRREPKTVADVDLEALKRQMSATIAKAKADDPRELRKKIQDLEKQIKANSVPAAAPAPKEKRVEIPAIKHAQITRLERAIGRYEVVAEALAKTHGELIAAFVSARTALHAAAVPRGTDVPRGHGAVRGTAMGRQTATQDRGDAGLRGRAHATRPAAPVNGNGSSEGITPAKQKILNGLAFLHGIGVAPADKTQLALIVGVSPTSGGYFNNLGGLRSAGLIDYPSGGTVALTGQGEKLASTDGVPSNTDELHEAIRSKLPPAKWKILEALIPIYPDAMTKDTLAERIGVSATSGGYFNNLGSLRSLGLISYPRPSEVAALPVLFLEG